MNKLPDIEALALLEIDGLPRAVLAQDAALKKAPVRILACAPVSPGKALLLFHGDVASVEEALAVAERLAGARCIDRLFLPYVHAGVVAAIGGVQIARRQASLAILELSSVAATLLAADAALKCSDVAIGRMHLASGFGGKGYFTLVGLLSDLEAATEAALGRVGERLLDSELLAAPHDELDQAAFVRPWALDPAIAE